MTAIYRSARIGKEKREETETHGRNEDKQRFKNLYILSKQIQTQINKDEILG